MDPSQTWSDLARAIERDDWDEATELAEMLVDWIERQGFPTCDSDRRRHAAELERTIWITFRRMHNCQGARGTRISRRRK